jgi:outer membrane protein assembly factor BamE
MRPLASFLFLPLILSLPLTGCSGWSNPIDKLSPYKIDIQQGNVINQEMLDKLKPGMTPSQVRFILGTPLVEDPFHPERWDYVYRYIKAGRLTEHRRVSILFADDKLKGIEGDVVAAGQNTPAKPASKPEGGQP